MYKGVYVIPSSLLQYTLESVNPTNLYWIQHCNKSTPSPRPLPFISQKWGPEETTQLEPLAKDPRMGKVKWPPYLPQKNFKAVSGIIKHITSRIQYCSDSRSKHMFWDVSSSNHCFIACRSLPSSAGFYLIFLLKNEISVFFCFPLEK